MASKQMTSGGSVRRKKSKKQPNNPPIVQSPPPANTSLLHPPKCSISLPPAFFAPPPPSQLNVNSSHRGQSGSTINSMPTQGVISSMGTNISLHSSCSSMPVAASPTSSPASSVPSISGLRIGVPGTPISPSVDSTTPAASQSQNDEEDLEFDDYGRLIIIPDNSGGFGEGFIPSKATGKMMIAAIKPFFRKPWVTWKEIPYDIRILMWSQFQVKCKWESHHENEINTIFEKKAAQRIKEHLYEARKKKEKPGWEGFQKGLEDWHQTTTFTRWYRSPASSADMNSIWTEVAGGPKKGRVYGLGVVHSSCRPSPLLSNASASQNTEEVEELRKEIAELKQRFVKLPTIDLLKLRSL